MDENTRERLHARMAELLEDRLGPEGEAELHDLLSSSPEARALYGQYLELHADLALRTTEPAAVERPVPAARRSRWAVPLTVAAMLLVGIWLGWQGGTHRRAPLGRIVSVEGSATARYAPGPLHAGELAVAGDGRLRLEMSSGARVTLPGGGRVEVVDPKMVRLIRGQVVVDVPERAIGFRVVTASADVVDLGTEFGVSVDETGSTEVHVFRGVVVTRSFGGTRVVPLVANEAGVLDPLTGEIQPIPVNPRSFGVSAPSGPARAVPTASRDRLPPGARVVFLGDRMTARGTHLLLMNQALRPLPEAEAPRLFNAAIAFRLFFTEEDMARYVGAYRPTHAVLEFGPDIAGAANPETPESFGNALVRLVDRLRREGVEPILTTGYPTDRRNGDAQRLLDRYNERIRNLAAERGLRFVDVDRIYRTDGQGGRSFVLPRVNVPTFEGFRVLAGELLGAMGFTGVGIPTSADPRPLPGLIREWRIRHKPKTALLTEDSIREAVPDGTWEALVLPMEDRYSTRLPDPSHAPGFQQARQGFALGLHRRGMWVEAAAEVSSETPRDAVVNIGGAVRTVWLNGSRIHSELDGGAYTGSAAGKVRIPVRLRAGTNRIVVEATSNFFCSLTDTMDWALPR